MTKKECIKKGYDLSLCLFYDNGLLSIRSERNHDKTQTRIIEIYHKNGQLQHKFEWNDDKTRTCMIEIYHENGQLQEKFEWNGDKTDTSIIEAYFENGQVKEMREWNRDKTATFLIEEYNRKGNLLQKFKWNDDRTETIEVEQSQYFADGVEIDWEQRRYEIAKDILCVYVNSNEFAIKKEMCCESAVAYADTLIEHLKSKTS